MRALSIALTGALLASAPAAAQTVQEQALLHRLAGEIRPERMRADIEAMVGFGTRHTMSETASDTRGIGAARRWAQGRFEAISRDCGGCLTVATPSDTVTSPRIPTPTEVVDIVAIQRGTGDPNRVIIISGHIDSRVSDVMNFTDDAPGANDDASGVAAVLEAARVLSGHSFDATLVYAALSGEEQGLFGGKILADYARARGWRVEANLNNDIVGNSEGQSGVRDTTRVRVFSEGTKTVETEAQEERRRYNGGEVDSSSRNLARFIDGIADRYLANFDVDLIYRTDRYGRGGDQVEMLRAGFPAVRISEGAENYDRQHQDLRVEDGVHYGDTIDGVDFDYLGQVARLNIVAMAALANAPASPLGVTIEGAVKPDTTVKWQAVPGAAGYRVWWRSTTAPQWTHSRWAGSATELTLPGIVIDDWFFGVSAVSDDGYESPVVFPGPAGSFVSVGDPAPRAAR
ncbi:MAG: M28 family peptidase [Alphaproteobacteria bacterium]|jgi:Zn-dependent M28 family amino/carboxypeptidase|nr:M28 family peptidase [Alphaproteobacteria bacterium]MBU2042624.1 M28 family peptidase [Alphaproteobacteria bacterium]MBU2124519.1 M28 family peptidase [Alphaproteobacteria bacterium]MBU2209638.1 M28 family peptidase [Alphaproteobacteria bacterium]MBU2292018.1 M28 family peptidase [Alphaproteobacteria bacterium]